MDSYIGESIAVGVAFLWTIGALFLEKAIARIGPLVTSTICLLIAALLSGVLLYVLTGSFFAIEADSAAWGWLALSGAVGFVFGDFCLFCAYSLITARFTQLIMTLAPPFAALFAWWFLDEKLSLMGYLGMFVTLLGIAISIFTRKEEGSSSFAIKLPLRGVLLAVAAALGQGSGIVLSKVGMVHYQKSVETPEMVQYIPFAATHIRILAGVVGFILVVLATGRGRKFVIAFRDAKALRFTAIGSIAGPFLGVSFALMSILYANAAIASTIMATVPLLILVPYRFYYKRHITTAEMVGASISVVGVSLFFL